MPKICVLQFYTPNVSYGKFSEEINRKYCEKHGYDYIVEKDDEKLRSLAADRAFTWIKPRLINQVIGDYDYVLFMDIDAIFCDFEKKIEEFIEPGFDLVAAEDYGAHSKMNAGVLLFRNCDWTRNFLGDWWNKGGILKGSDVPDLGVKNEQEGYFKHGYWHDQSCLSYLYLNGNQDHIKIISHRSFNWWNYDEGNFIFHAFARGHMRNRSLDKIHAKIFKTKIDPESMTLVQLAEFYGTDKEYEHHYVTNHYEKIFSPLRKTTKRVCEVGVLDGDSLMMFRDFFSDAVVVGCDFVDKSIQEERIQIVKMDQSSDEELDFFCSSQDDFDIILDDGSHKMRDQQITFAKLFKKLSPGGIFVVEDLHTSLEARMPEKYCFAWGDPEKTTTLDLFENYISSGKIKSDYISEDDCQYLEDNIDNCEVLRSDNCFGITSIIRKKSSITDVGTIYNNKGKKTMIAVVFYCWAISDWNKRTVSAFNRLKTSGLYDVADELYFVVSDTEDKRDEIEDLVRKFPKFTLEYESENLGSEYRGIKRVEEIGRREKEYKILYFHAKGVHNKYKNVFERSETHQLKIDGINCWSEMLTYFVVDRWKECVEKLNDGFDTAGAACHNRWWWGNFWWASSRHIKKLKNFEGGSRWSCEAWLHENLDSSKWDFIRSFEQNKFRYNPYYTVIPRCMYEKNENFDISIEIKKAEYGCFGEQIDEGRKLPQEPNIIDVTDKVKELSLANQIIYPKSELEQLHFCDGEKNIRVYFSISTDPDVVYVVTSHPMFDDICLYSPCPIEKPNRLKGIV
jgi:hypothetical protein